MQKKLGFLSGLAVAVLFSAAPSFAQAVKADDPRTIVETAPNADASTISGEGESWGTTSDSIYNVGADDFSVRLAEWPQAQLLNNARIEPTNTGSLDITGPIHLPSGSLIRSITVFYTDNIAGEPSATLFAASTTGALTALQNITFPAFTGGNNSVTVTPTAPGITVSNLDNTYGLSIGLTKSAAGSHGIYRARIRYRLQVSPAPAVASFADVPTSDGRFRFVEALVASGLTSGCGGGNFCPDQPVTRGQIAVFLASALGMHFPD